MQRMYACAECTQVQPCRQALASERGATRARCSLRKSLMHCGPAIASSVGDLWQAALRNKIRPYPRSFSMTRSICLGPDALPLLAAACTDCTGEHPSDGPPRLLTARSAPASGAGLRECLGSTPRAHSVPIKLLGVCWFQPLARPQKDCCCKVCSPGAAVHRSARLCRRRAHRGGGLRGRRCGDARLPAACAQRTARSHHRCHHRRRP